MFVLYLTELTQDLASKGLGVLYVCLYLTELTQDLASKGLGVVYEVCDEEQRQQLVSLLVDTLTTGRKYVYSNQSL